MQKHKFSVLCPNTLFVESILVPPGALLMIRDPDAPECTMLPTDHIGCREHKFDVTCPGVLLMETMSGPSEHEK
jgi:hypothetical protein